MKIYLRIVTFESIHECFNPRKFPTIRYVAHLKLPEPVGVNLPACSLQCMIVLDQGAYPVAKFPWRLL